MGLIYQERPDRGVTYVYSSESYYDPAKKQSRSKRKLIGKLDPDTGEVVPTGKRGPKKGASQDAETGKPVKAAKAKAKSEEGGNEAENGIVEDLSRQIEEKDKEIGLLKTRIGILERDNEKLRADNDRIGELLTGQREQLAGVVDSAVLMTGKMKDILSMK